MTLNNTLAINFEKEFKINLTNEYKSLNLWDIDINITLANFFGKV